MDWQSKLEHVLEGKCNENLEKILNYLEKQENQETKFGLVTHPVFTKWIEKIVVTWNTNRSQSSTKTLSLVLSLASFLTKKEENFCSLSISFPTKLILKAKETLGNSGVTLAYIRLLSSFLDHKSGIEWMMVCNFWEDVHNFAISKETGEIIDESIIFLSKLLEKSINYDDKFADKVVKKLMSPLGDNVLRRLKAPDVDTQNRIASKYIKPTLRLIERILLHFMDGIYLKKKDFTVAVIFLKNFHLEERISDFMIIAQLKSLVFEISKIMFIMQFLELYVKTLRNKIIAADINSTIERIKNNFVGTVAKKDFEDVPLDLARFSVLYWNLVQSTIPLQQDKLTLADEFSKIFALPGIALVFKNCYSNFSELDKIWLEDDIRSLFIQKMVKTVDHGTFRVFIEWRDKLMANPKLFYLGTQYLIQLKKTIKYLNTEQAIRIFQALQYVLKDLGRVIKEQAEEFEHFFRETQYFALVFEVIRLLVEKFHIKWNDSYETLEVMGVCFDYLMLPEWQSPVVVQILKLVGTTIVKNMSPNLALLVDDNTDSSIALLGPLLYRKMLDEEVKMAALELVHTVTKISNKTNSLALLQRMEWQSKLEGVLVSLLKGDVPDEINKNLETFLTFFKKQEEINSGLITLPLFKEWLIQSVATWDINKITPSTHITSFTLNLASFLSKNEGNFYSLNTNNFYAKLIRVLMVRPVAPSVSVAYINLLTSLLEHKPGVKWMMDTNFWEEIDTPKFMSKFLEKVIDHDGDFCDRIVQRLLSGVYDKTGELVASILLSFMDGIFLGEKDFRVALVFLKNFSFGCTLPHNNHVSKIIFIMRLLQLYVKKLNISSVVGQIRKDFLATLARDDFTKNTADFCSFGVLYWNLLASKIQKTTFATELLMVLTTSNFGIMIEHCYSSYLEVDELASADDMRGAYTEKITKSISSDVFRICYKWRDRFAANPENYNMFNMCTQNLIYVKESLKYVSSEQAIKVFETLIYYLMDIIGAIKKIPKKFNNFVQEPPYVALMFETVRLCIQNFHIKWDTSCETIEVMGVCFDYLVLPWPPMVLVQIFKLLNVAITNYMPPNLALLLDSADSSISLLGPLLYLKMRDDNLKMAALELVYTVTKIANKKFPSLQKVLLDSELPSLVLKIGTSHREEKPVQAMAIKCLREMIQVEDIWSDALKTQNLSEKMCGILLHNFERSICVEVATLISVAYQHQQLPQNLDNIYETMIDASTNNLYWDVRVCGLKFWDRVISTNLQNQGMIDDYFPEVTFSKEHRKIVTLTDSEIRRRLLKVLSELSTIGCLGVLVHAIKDDCDKEVCKVAVDITERLVILFERYHLKDDGGGPLSPQSVSSGVSVDSPGSGAIDEIVNNEAERMLSAYCSSDYGSVRSDDLHPQTKNMVSPNEFLQFCQEDFNSFISEKKNWLHGIEELELVLDTMLRGVKK